jgi:hypothetical protein
MHSVQPDLLIIVDASLGQSVARSRETSQSSSKEENSHRSGHKQVWNKKPFCFMNQKKIISKTLGPNIPNTKVK